MEIDIIWLSTFFLVYTVAVIAATTVVVRRKASGKGAISTADSTNKAINKIPEVPPIPKPEEGLLIQIYQTEWKSIIETQMHFNDLIIRFRSIVLTVLIALVGTCIALNANEKIDEELLPVLLSFALVFWVTAFVLDRYYYHRLLLGSVNQAMKFDESQLGKKYGLFGLTTCIANAVHPPTSNILISIFYGLPALSLVVYFIWQY